MDEERRTQTSSSSTGEDGSWISTGPHLGTKPRQVSPGQLRPLPLHKMDTEDVEPLLKKLERNSTRIIILQLSFVL